MTQESIHVKGANANNLNNISLRIPLNRLVVVTGVSGSGKSSLAFDTLYAEGQRRYVQSLSAYARQFLGRMPKPDVASITNLPPAIAIEQKVKTRNPRSTVGTSTEIQDYLRMLFARIGKTYSPVSGREVKRDNPDNVVKSLLSSFPEGTRMAVLTPIELPDGRTLSQQLAIYLQEGFSRLLVEGEFAGLDDEGMAERLSALGLDNAYLVVDRLSVSSDADEVSRLTDSVERAFFEGRNRCAVAVWAGEKPLLFNYSNRFESDGIDFREPSDLMFNFNNPYGACEKCEGFGSVLGISEDLVVPDKGKSVFGGAVACWNGETMGEWRKELVRIAPRYSFPVHKPYAELTEAEKDFLWHGNHAWEGIDGFFRWVDKNQYKIQYRVLKARYRGKTLCPVCKGSRLRPDVEYVKICGHTITELSEMPVKRLLPLMRSLELSDTERIIAKRLMTEIVNRLEFLDKVGLGYLTLSRRSNTLSGGESQRINLATSLGSSLVGSLYILDEPSIGLHPRDSGRLIEVLKELRDLGNSVIVVEHDREIMEQSDYIVDIGPGAGVNGGEVVATISHCDVKPEIKGDSERSETLRYLSGELKMPVPDRRRKWKKFIEVKDARQHNLKGIDVKFPLEVMTVVSGVSGSGKSTLVRDILYKAVCRHLDIATDKPGSHGGISGNLDAIGAVEFVDQNPIGASTRSNAVTYLGVYDEIRKLFAAQPLAKQMGFTAGYFSFNTEGGRCPECQGEGKIHIPMQFMADIEMECEECHGKRFTRDVLEVKYRDRSIHEILEMSSQEAYDFFMADPDRQAQRIAAGLKPLLDVGLGYISLGQSSSTLSGGENQRVKLASYIGSGRQTPTLFIFDEPTTGLHFSDVNTLLSSLNRLVDKGHTVVIIEHNTDMIKAADYVIDLGPEGGEEGGRVVATGTPEEIMSNPDSITGRYLK